MARPWRASSAEMVHGGTTWSRLKWVKGHRPLALHAAAQRHVAGVHALGEADEVRGDTPVVDGEPLAAPAEPGHHLVADHDDAVAVAQRPHPRQVAVRGHEDAVRADDGLEDDGGDRG